MTNTPTREHREAAISLCHGNPARCCKDWAEFETAPELHTSAVRVAQALADVAAAAEQRGFERGRETERAEVVAWLKSLGPVGRGFASDIESGKHLAKGE